MGIPRGVSRRHQYFVDKFLPIWIIYRHELSQEEQLILNIGFGISGEVLSYTEIARQLGCSGSQDARRLLEDALLHLRKVARTDKRGPSSLFYAQ